jgi:hypothetical protein
MLGIRPRPCMSHKGASGVTRRKAPTRPTGGYRVCLCDYGYSPFFEEPEYDPPIQIALTHIYQAQVATTHRAERQNVFVVTVTWSIAATSLETESVGIELLQTANMARD